MKLFNKSVVFLLTGLTLFFSACVKDNDPEPSPTDARAKYLGVWNVTETKGKLSYQVTITADEASSDNVFMDNFGAFNASAVATVSGNTITAVSNQPLGTVLLIAGSGTYSSSSNTILFTYTYNDQANQITATAIYSK